MVDWMSLASRQNLLCRHKIMSKVCLSVGPIILFDFKLFSDVLFHFMFQSEGQELERA